MLRLPVVRYTCQQNEDCNTTPERDDHLAETHVSKDLPP